MCILNSAPPPPPLSNNSPEQTSSYTLGCFAPYEVALLSILVRNCLVSFAFGGDDDVGWWWWWWWLLMLMLIRCSSLVLMIFASKILINCLMLICGGCVGGNEDVCWWRGVFLPTLSSCFDCGFWHLWWRCHPFYFSSLVAFHVPSLSWLLLISLLIFFVFSSSIFIWSWSSRSFPSDGGYEDCVLLVSGDDNFFVIEQ